MAPKKNLEWKIGLLEAQLSKGNAPTIAKLAVEKMRRKELKKKRREYKMKLKNSQATNEDIHADNDKETTNDVENIKEISKKILGSVSIDEEKTVRELENARITLANQKIEFSLDDAAKDVFYNHVMNNEELRVNSKKLDLGSKEEKKYYFEAINTTQPPIQSESVEDVAANPKANTKRPKISINEKVYSRLSKSKFVVDALKRLEFVCQILKGNHRTARVEVTLNTDSGDIASKKHDLNTATTEDSSEKTNKQTHEEHVDDPTVDYLSYDSDKGPVDAKKIGPNESLFMETLGGSDYSDSDYDSDREQLKKTKTHTKSTPEVPKKKNRPGQRERRAQHERAYGRDANHIKIKRKDTDSSRYEGQDVQENGAGNTSTFRDNSNLHSTKKARMKQYKAGVFSKGAKVVFDQDSKSAETRPQAYSEAYGRATPGFASSGTSNTPRFASKGFNTNGSDNHSKAELHPSWEAKKLREKEQMALLNSGVKGQKIVFD
ncbi:hypothetical protein AX774_g339 [Zancudomyces culisetae]|uniref:Bud22 domain-containing protein n=1 Tax=Zancudomyces culisetae TaxID=1213189 RepID=A0A1R1PYV4_ZANCU|nr:hypothetical protein AX774_g339 [Zancudomyces culisetae]|eukprot:OMH86109.1 hypothetical protein AX774_g339 [Zancudomyces culisetae]